MNSSRLLKELVAPVIAIAQVAGNEILGVYNTEFSVNYKDDSSPLTLADRRAHEAIESGLNALTPEYPVLSEEDADIPFSERAAWQRYWLVDPLDGTREFVKRNGEFTVNIALMENCRPVLGVIQVPVTGRVFSAWQGGGAHSLEVGSKSRPIRAKSEPGVALRVVCSRSHTSPDLKKFLDKLGDYSTLSIGSSLKVCLIAEGKADLYPRLGPTSEWDTAAADCILSEAGGQITQLDSTPLKYNKESLLNPSFMAVGIVDDRWRRALSQE